MPATLRKLSETTWSIGTTATDPTGDTFTVIEGAYAGGNLGEMWKTVDATGFKDAYTQIAKVQRDPGKFDLKVRRMESVVSSTRSFDAGQAALKTAYESQGIYNFKVDVGGEGKLVISFKAQVTSFVRAVANPAALNEINVGITIVGATTETLTA